MPYRNTEDKAIPTNLRLLLLLEELAKIGVPVNPTTANESLGLPKPTVHRLFQTLEAEGFLQRDLDGRSYGPGRRLRRMAVDVLSSSRVRVVRLQVLTALADEIGETCNIATPDRDAMIYLDRIETKWPLRIQLPIGTSVPFHCTASGKMYLASLPPRHIERFLASAKLEQQTSRTLSDRAALAREIAEIAKRGYATDNEEFMDGMVALAVPILGDQNRLVSTLSVHAPAQRLPIEELIGYLDRLQEAAASLSDLMLK